MYIYGSVARFQTMLKQLCAAVTTLHCINSIATHCDCKYAMTQSRHVHIIQSQAIIQLKHKTFKLEQERKLFFFCR